MEETGYDIRSLEHLVGFYPSPGVSNEFVDLFLGTELVRVGCPQLEGEEGVLEQVTVPLQEAVHRVLSGELLDGKTMIGILLCFHRLAAPGGPRPQPA
jgi:ADP-ribose pyrophosphatase